MRIGIDFDNTIVCYDAVFHQIAVERSLIPSLVPATKNSVRDYLREHDREDEWTQLQGVVYGQRILDAKPFPRVRECLTRLSRSGAQLCIISHKTRYPIRGPRQDLHQAASDWLRCNGIVDSVDVGISASQVFFELTKADKLGRIAAQRCDWFIDDLPEFLAEPRFPLGVNRILFDPADQHDGQASAGMSRVTSWEQIGRLLLQPEVAR